VTESAPLPAARGASLLSPFASIVETTAPPVKKTASKKAAKTNKKKPSKKKTRRKKAGAPDFPRGQAVAKDPGRFLIQMVSVHGSVQLADEVGGTPKTLSLDDDATNKAHAIAHEVGVRLDGLEHHLDDVFNGDVEVVTAVRLSRVLRTTQQTPGNRTARLHVATPFQGFCRMHIANVRQNITGLRDEMAGRLAQLSPAAADVVRLDAALTDAMGLKIDAIVAALQLRLHNALMEALKDPVADLLATAEEHDGRPDAEPLCVDGGVLHQHQQLIGQTVRAFFLVEEKRLRTFCQAFVDAGTDAGVALEREDIEPHHLNDPVVDDVAEATNDDDDDKKDLP